jgi:hypothetical protein
MAGSLGSVISVRIQSLFGKINGQAPEINYCISLIASVICHHAGKHMVAKRKWTNTVAHDERVNKTTVLPVVAIRDPYSWMQSLCRHPYGTYVWT